MTKRIGILGGGQLGKMLFEAGSPMNIPYVFLETSTDCPASLVCNNQLVGSLQNAEKIKELSKQSDVISYEIEHVNVEALIELEREQKTVIPKSSVLYIIQDKGLQKQFYTEHSIPTLPYKICDATQLAEALTTWDDTELVLKHRKGGYDGKGVQLVTKAELQNLIDQHDSSVLSEHGYVLEKTVHNATEISVIVAVDQFGDVLTYSASEMIFDPKSNLMDYLITPSSLAQDINDACSNIAKRAVLAFDSPGLFAVELFVTSDNQVFVNEIAPRPHNSGHHTIESCYTSQYEQLNRILLGQPLGSTKLLCPSANCNIVGPEGVTGSYYLHNLDEIMKIEGVYVHLYGKIKTSPNRKLGHFTVIAATREATIEKMNSVKQLLSIKSC